MNCIAPAESKDRWQTLVNAVMNIRVPQNAGKFLTGGGNFFGFSGRILL
jgi:hypothetical protein